MTLLPSPPDNGIIFRRMDLPDTPVVEACPENILDVHYATTLGKGGVEVKTVEHLLAALAVQPDTAMEHHHLGLIYMGRGNNRRALTWLNTSASAPWKSSSSSGA